MLNTEFSWGRENLGEVETVSGAAILIENEMVREALKKMKKGKAAGPSKVVAEMVKAAGDKGIEMIADLSIQIIRVSAIPEDWEISTIINCYKGKADAPERG